MTTINKTKVYVLTAIAALLYVGLTVAFADDLWKPGNFWSSEYIFEGTWVTYLLFAAILGGGFYKTQQVGDREIDVTPTAGAEADGQVEDPSFWKLFIGNTWYAVLWMPIRFFVGQEWLVAGEHKVRDDAWMSSGDALKGYFERAVAIPEAPARPAITYDWFRQFLQYMLDHEWYTWFAKIVAVGEVLVGLGLIFGALVGIAAFFGTLMNFNFLLAGSASTNPVLFGLGVFIVLGWKVAGHLGIDRWLLPILGTPWRPGPARKEARDERPMIQRHHPA
jgi:thiosulfate dehydrogenase [quinone] large subunit